MCICNNERRGIRRRPTFFGRGLYCDCDRAIAACAYAVKRRYSYFSMHYQKADDVAFVFNALTAMARC